MEGKGEGERDLASYTFRKRGSEFLCSMLIGSPANMKESRRSRAQIRQWSLVFGTRSSQVSLSFPLPFLLPLPLPNAFRAHFIIDNRFYLVPFPSCQSTTNSWHMNG